MPIEEVRNKRFNLSLKKATNEEKQAKDTYTAFRQSGNMNNQEGLET